jgi:hypothetical protein
MMSKGHSKIFSASRASEKETLMKSPKFLLITRMAFRTQNLPSRRLKNEFGEVDEVMFLGVENPCEHILCFLGIEKSNLVEVA